MSTTPSLSSNNNKDDSNYLNKLLESAKPFLRCELDKVHPNLNLTTLVSVLRSVGAGECWHKHGSFLDHLVDIHRILHLWGSPPTVSLTGLFHSAYSNSYVNLAIFNPSTGRDTVRSYVGHHAEHLIHLFCIIPRQSLIHDDLLFHYSDSELIRHLQMDDDDDESEWRIKINSIVPKKGVVVKHIRTGEDVRVSRRIVAVFLLMTMADFSDQLFSFQDVLFENNNGRLEFTGNNFQALWPGDGKPGLWLNSISRMGAIYRLIVREEEIINKDYHDDEALELELVIPPVFERCTKVLDARDQIEARDLYWEAVCEYGKMGLEKVEEVLLNSIKKNPYVGEPRVVLAQVYLGKNMFEKAETEAEKGVKLMLEWGSAWDKRMPWEGWIAWGRVLLMKAKERSWPQTSFGILNLGLVK